MLNPDIYIFFYMCGRDLRTFTKGRNWLAGRIILKKEMILVQQFLLKTHNCPACYSFFIGIDLSGWEISVYNCTGLARQFWLIMSALKCPSKKDVCLIEGSKEMTKYWL